MVREDTLTDIEKEQRRARARSAKRLAEMRAARRKEQRIKLAKGALLVALIGGLIGAGYYLWTLRPVQVTEVTITDFATIPEIEEVVERPPRLLLIVDEERWGEMTTGQKRDLMERAGAIVDLTGYRVAEVRTAIAFNLATWQKDGTITVDGEVVPG